MTLEKQIAEDYVMVLKEAQSMGCNKINALYNIPLDNMKAIVNALEEVQKYRAIGTVEECMAAVEKQKAEKPTPIDYKKYVGVVDNAVFLRGAYWCPRCNHVVRSGDYCNDCGQKLDWSDEE